MASDIILETRSLTKEFKGFVAVNSVDLRVKRGTIHALIGPNGAGKTTCFNLLTHFLTPTRGRITYNGRDITGSRPAEIARRGLVRSFQISAVFPHLTVLENVRIALQRQRGSSFDFWRPEKVLDGLKTRAMELIEAVGLGGFSGMTAVELPYGRKRALEIATTLALDPEMMLLDEPTAGMAHEDVDRISALIRKVAANRTVLMVEHNLSVVADLSQIITVLARGEILARRLCGIRESRRDPGHREPPMPEGAGSTPGGTAALLTVQGLNAWYGESHILHGVDFAVRAGEVVTLLGRNGAKTTTLKWVMGQVGEGAGSIRFEGTGLIGMRSRKIARLGSALCPEERGIFGSLNVEENLVLPPQVRAGGLSLGQIYDLFPNLKERLASQGTKLSGGEQQMLAIGRILRTGARLLLLDEPTEGLAPVIVQQIGRTIARLKSEGFTILPVEQNFRFAATVADRHYVMEHGRVMDV